MTLGPTNMTITLCCEKNDTINQITRGLKNSEVMTRVRFRFWKPPRNNGRMAFWFKLRGWSPSLQATRRDNLLRAIYIIRLPIRSLLAFQTSSCAALHILSFSSPAPASEDQYKVIRNSTILLSKNINEIIETIYNYKGEKIPSQHALILQLVPCLFLLPHFKRLKLEQHNNKTSLRGKKINLLTRRKAHKRNI